MKNTRILTLPGWKSSGPDHWQSRWEHLHDHQRVEQHDWQRPLRGDWSARLHETVLDHDGPVVLVADGLGCLLAAWWAAHSPLASRVQAALLVAPCDTESEKMRQRLPGWAPIARQPLPFPALLVGNYNDIHCTPDYAQRLATAWGVEYVDGGTAVGDWPEGLALLQALSFSNPCIPPLLFHG